MAITGYLYRSNQQPAMSQDWHCGRMLGATHRTVALDSVTTEGEIVSIHMGHGMFRDYRIEAADNKTALLVAV